MDNTDMYWDDICWNDVVPDWENCQMMKMRIESDISLAF